MRDKDWRLEGAIAELLLGSTFVWRRAGGASRSDGVWAHDHCELCFATFGARDEYPRRLTGGYVAPGERDRWVCGECFDDFRGLFKWSVVGPEPLH